MKNNTISNEQALQDFLLDISCLDELAPWTSQFNIFDVLKITKTEIRHSNMLSWLLDSNENHGLGDKFVSCIIQVIMSNNQVNDLDFFNYLLADYHSFTVYREWKNIDILLESIEEKIIIAIENKVGSHEHSNQLNRYRKTIEDTHPDYKRLYVFLTPDGDTPSDNENWLILTYDDIAEALEYLCDTVNIAEDVKSMIKNYISVIRRDIVEDKNLVEICNKIYSKHKQALDLIFNNRTISSSNISTYIADTLHKLSAEGKIIYEEGYNTCFRTEKMDSLLPLLDEPVSAWNSHNVYYYWFRYENDRFYLIFEITGTNIPPEHMKVMDGLISILKPNANKKPFTWKRLFRTAWFDVSNSDDIEADTEKFVRQAVDEMLRMEKEVLRKYKVLN